MGHSLALKHHIHDGHTHTYILLPPCRPVCCPIPTVLAPRQRWHPICHSKAVPTSAEHDMHQTRRLKQSSRVRLAARALWFGLPCLTIDTVPLHAPAPFSPLHHALLSHSSTLTLATVVLLPNTKDDGKNTLFNCEVLSVQHAHANDKSETKISV